jgi:hypothetical protein
MVLVKLHVELEPMGEQVVPQFIFNISRHAHQDPPLKEKEDSLPEGDAHHQQAVLKELRPSDFQHQVIHCLAHNHRGGDADGIANKNAQNAQNQRPKMTPMIAEQSLQRRVYLHMSIPTIK